MILLVIDRLMPSLDCSQGDIIGLVFRKPSQCRAQREAQRLVALVAARTTAESLAASILSYTNTLIPPKVSSTGEHDAT
jgi:hypothetical protein